MWMLLISSITLRIGQNITMRLIIASILAAGTALAQLKEMPAMGLGTWHLQDNGKDVSEIIANAIQVGYKHIDCAYAYENQKQIGAGIKKGLNRTGLQRKDLWITGKLWNNRYSSPAFISRR
jgi:diketogulonate reductase-like aldo/keto reductase